MALSHRGDTVAFRLDAPAHAGLTALARRGSATVFMAVQAGLAALLTRLGAGTDIAIGTVVAGRTDKALDDLVGFFVNPLVLRADTSGDPRFAELLARIRASDLAAYAHQDLPFEHVVELLNPARDRARNPLFQVMLAFGNGTGGAPALPGLGMEPVRIDAGVARLDLAFSLRDCRRADGAADGIEGTLEYATDLFDRDSAQRLADRLARLLAAVAADPDVRIGAVDMLIPGERELTLKNGTGPVRRGPARTLAELFEDQAARTPDADAIQYHGHSLSYATLNARANELARRLIRHGAGPERLVAVALPRSADLVIAVLAVTKAGAAYLPIDVRYPAERIDLMLRGADLPVVVATTQTACCCPCWPIPSLCWPGAGATRISHRRPGGMSLTPSGPAP